MGQYQLTKNEQTSWQLWLNHYGNNIICWYVWPEIMDRLNTVTGTAALPNIISVEPATPICGGRITAGRWKSLHYGISVQPDRPRTVLWYPCWLRRECRVDLSNVARTPYRLDEGTSLAAPHVAEPLLC